MTQQRGAPSGLNTVAGQASSPLVHVLPWPEPPISGSLPIFLASWANLFHWPLTTEVDVGQHQYRERPC
jgi:hypothetical protein